MTTNLSRGFARTPVWSLRQPPADSTRARLVTQRWRWPTVLALAGTVPAFYAELLRTVPAWQAAAAYGLAAAILATALLHTAWRCRHPALHLRANRLDSLLAVGLLLAALLPASSQSSPALALRLLVALLSLGRMVWAVQHLVVRGSLLYLLGVAAGVLGLCGVGYWWLEPTTPTLGDGLWLAFATAASVGYGDVVPSTPASKIFSVFVVMLGFGVLSLVTAAIATRWIATEERVIEREILRDLHRQIDALHQDMQALRAALVQPAQPGQAGTPGQHGHAAQPAQPASDSPPLQRQPVRLQGQQAVEDQ